LFSDNAKNASQRSSFIRLSRPFSDRYSVFFFFCFVFYLSCRGSDLVSGFSKTIIVRDLSEKLVGLLSTEASSFIKDRLKPFVGILQGIYPDSFKPVNSSKAGPSFKNIQLDVYNRFAESVSTFRFPSCNF
jgi:hypothetical protein